MKVKELIEVLKKYDSELDVVVDRHSDYSELTASGICIVLGAPVNDWVMRSAEYMSEENKRKEKEYLSLSYW